MSSLEAVKEAWNQLPEKEKKIICKCIFKNEPRRFAEWCKFAGITSGFRLQTIARRDIGAQQLDKVFFEIRNGEFARFRIKNFFCEHHSELNDLFLQIAKEEKADISKDMKMLLAKLRTTNADNPFIDFFCTSSEWMISDWDEDTTDREEESDDMEHEDIERTLEIEFEHLSELPAKVKEPIEKLAHGVMTDINSLVQILEQAFASGDSLRSKTYEIAKSVGIIPREWQNQDEFKELLASIRQKRSNLLKTRDLSEFYLNLMRLLTACKIAHKSQTIRSRWESLKEGACSQLGAVAESENPLELPRSRELSPVEWIEWSLTLTDSALDELIKLMECSLSKLGQLICEVERHHLEFGSQETNVGEISSFAESLQSNSEDDNPAEEVEAFQGAVSFAEVEEVKEKHAVSGNGTVEDNTCAQKCESEIVVEDINNEPKSASLIEVKIGINEGDTLSPNKEIEETCNYEALFSSLIGERNLEWAYWLSVALGPNSTFPNWLMDVCDLGMQFQPMFKASEDQLRRIFENPEISAQLDDLDQNGALILGASLVRPLLMAPYTYPMYFMKMAAEKLHHLSDFYRLAEELCNFATKGLSLGVDLVQGLSSIGDWEAEKQLLEQFTDEWLNAAPKRTIVYPKATRVWEHWVSPNGELRVLIENCRSNPLSKETFGQALYDWKDESRFERKMDLANRELTRGPQPEPIRFGAKDRLRRHVEEAIEIAEKWLAYHARKTQSGNERHGLQELQRLAPIARNVAAGLEEFASSGLPITVAGTRLMAKAMEELYSLYKEGVATREVDPVIARETELLLLPTVTGRDGELLGDEKFLEAIKSHLGEPLALEDSFNRHLENGHLALAGRIVHMLPEAIQDRCRQSIEAKQKEWNKKIVSKFREMNEELMGMLLKGAISETDQEKWNNEINRLEKTFKENPQEPYRIIASIERIKKSAWESANNLILKVRKQMDQLIAIRLDQGQTISPDIISRFNMAIQKTDLSVANDIIMRVEDSSALDSFSDIVAEKPDKDYFVSYMNEVGRIFDYCADFRAACISLRNHSKWDLFPNSTFDEVHSRNVADTLTWWNSLQDRSSARTRFDKTQPADLFKLLRWLGFQIPAEVKLEEAEKSHGSPNFWQHYKIKGNIDSPIPLFGTQAHQTHHIVMVWGSLDSVEFARWLKSSDKIRAEDSITIIYFNRIDAISRRKAIHSLRKAGFSPLLVDACLIAWLCQLSGAERTTEFFNICLPGGRTNPYTPEVAGSVPKEMYFGRERDIEQLWKDDGPCIIYGGRQLGKSALLLQMKRRYHDPKNDNYVIYHGKFATELMDLIRRLLVNEGLLVDVKLNDDDKIKAAILKLLHEKPSCRIRILLDESDHLIEEDSKQRFKQLSIIRDIMTESNRRFKVVLAGLHSVQRFQRIPNQPLAHFGTPLCIGPLPPKDAESLVIAPLQLLGFRFDPPSLVQRVLTYTNFHPSLIQLFCHDLVEAMHDSQRVVIDDTPPFTIDEKTINRVFQKSSLAKKMRDRFDWTLDLDKRYRVIGYTIAFLEMIGDIPPEGLRVMEVLSHVKSFWPNGFSETNIDEISGLMVEMEGLGLLTHTPFNGYRLKSHNVLRLLGSEKEISDELNRFANEPFHHPADPQVIRRMLNYTSGKTSPLTISQETTLLQRFTGIDIVIGTAAHDVGSIQSALEQIIAERANSRENEPEFFAIDNHTSTESLVNKLKSIYAIKKTNRSYRVLVYRGTYNAEEYANQILASKQWIEGLKLEVKYFKVVAVIDPETLLQMHLQGIMEEFKGTGIVTIISLRRWHKSGIDHWFHDVGRTTSKDKIVGWLSVSGGWPCLVELTQNQLLDTAFVCPLETELSSILLKNLNISAVALIADVANFMAEYAEPLGKTDIVDFFADKYTPNEIEAAIHTLLDIDAATGSLDVWQLEKRLSAAIHAGE